MGRRFVSIWFPHLATDWFTLKQPHLRNLPLVLSAPSGGRAIITAVNPVAARGGIARGMAVADARALLPALVVLDHRQGLTEQLLQRIAEWCIRFTPAAAVDLPAGLILDVSGCTHLWGGDVPYLEEITRRLKDRGYSATGAMADTIGLAWGAARFSTSNAVIAPGGVAAALGSLPVAALRIERGIVDRLHKLGLRQIEPLLSMPRSALRRRFGNDVVQRLAQALGEEEESIVPVQPPQPFSERLPCPEPIVTLAGIEIALQRLLEAVCSRLREEGKGLRVAIFRGYRVDGRAQGVQVGTARASHNIAHLFYLFRIKLSTIEPALGIELFLLEAQQVEDHSPVQSLIWEGTGGLADSGLSELLDRLAGRMGEDAIRRFLPDEHYWPERSLKPAASLDEEATTEWNSDRPRPLQLLPVPQRIDVTAPVPDYPPMLFRYNGKVHTTRKADGPERIEQEWWIEDGEHRDYYAVEDEEGGRYWLFRLGHYDAAKTYGWYLHGFFA